MKSDLQIYAAVYMITPHWQHFEHKADIGVRGFGNTPAEAFAQAALAMSAIITELSLIADSRQVDIICEEAEIDLLFVDWLNTVIYEMSVRNMIFSRFHVAIENGHLTASAWGETIDVQRHQPAVEIKGATYTELAVYEKQGEWIAQCVVDV
jgi:SHS2 domain-containing protein